MQDTPPTAVDTFRALYTYRAFPGQHEQLQDVLVEACHDVRNDPGIIGLTLVRSTEFKGGFIVFSRWEDRLSLSECFMHHRDSGLLGRIADHCDVYSLDVFVPHDPGGAVGPTPGREGAVIASRLFLANTREFLRRACRDAGTRKRRPRCRGLSLGAGACPRGPRRLLSPSYGMGQPRVARCRFAAIRVVDRLAAAALQGEGRCARYP